MAIWVWRSMVWDDTRRQQSARNTRCASARTIGTWGIRASCNRDGCFGAARYADCVVWARVMAGKFPEDFRAFFLEASALALEGDLAAAAKAGEMLLRLNPRFSLPWMKENLPPTGELGERLREGLRRA